MDFQQKPEVGKLWARIVAKAWVDADFKARLLQSPETVLREEGVPLPTGVGVQILEEEGQGQRILVLPAPPADLGSIDNLEQRLAADTSNDPNGCM